MYAWENCFALQNEAKSMPNPPNMLQHLAEMLAKRDLAFLLGYLGSLVGTIFAPSTLRNGLPRDSRWMWPPFWEAKSLKIKWKW